jgi:Tfp pilus assembly protein PilF
LYANAGQFEAARAAVHEAMAIDPRRMDVLGSGAYVEERAGGGARAQEFLDRATNATPDSADAWFLKGRAQIAVGELRGARASLEQALALRPDWPGAAAQLAGVMIKTGDIDAAFKIVTRLKGKAGTRLEGEVLGADLEAARGNHAAAAEGYGRALALRPSSMLVLRRYQAQRSGRLPGALDGLKAWLGSHPQDTAVRFAYAEALQSNHVAQEAISQYEQALREAPNSAPGLNNLAWLYYSTKDPRALETARRAYALSPQTPAIADTLGWILVGQGQVSEGLGILKAAAAASGVEPDIRFHYAFALAKAGQTAESKQILDSILSSPANFEGRAAAEGLRKELK